MPELAEVEFYRRRWHEAGVGRTVGDVRVHPRARVFRETPAAAIARALRGATLQSSGSAAKQIAFNFGAAGWLGLHLGMSGELTVQTQAHAPGPHDHLVLSLGEVQLIFTDPRMFGLVRHSPGHAPPEWWTNIPPALTSSAFTPAVLQRFLQRRAGAPIKAVLLMQERFPGIGNWMADEILWRAEIHPAERAGTLTPAQTSRLWKHIRQVCRLALKAIAGTGGALPPDLNVNIPESWLFHHRWRDGGHCPKTRQPLARAVIAGRTTCWSPARQRLCGPPRMRG